MQADPGSVRVPGVLPSRPRPALLLVAICAVASAVVTTVLVQPNDGEPGVGVQGVLFVWIILTYTTSGLVAWWRRSESRFGPLMIVTGFATFLATLSFSDNAVLFTIGNSLDLVLGALVLHVLLAFPTGRLTDRLERVLVVATYGTAVGLQVLRMILGDPDSQLKVTDAPEAAELVWHVQYTLLTILVLTGVGLIVLRRRTERHALRRPLAFLIYAFSLSLLMIAFLLVVALLGKHGFGTVRNITLLVIGLAPVAFLVGLLDARLTRSSVADLVVALGRDRDPGAVRAALAQALRDPSLTLVYWVPELDSWTDLEGRPASLSTGADRSTTLIERDGRHIAALVHDPALHEEPELLAGVRAAAAMALENGQLRAKQRAHAEELRRTQARAAEAGQQERKRLERNLHDGAQQRLIALSLELALLERQVGSDPDVAVRLDRARKEVGVSLEELRDVAHGLHPSVLAGHGLVFALESVVDRAPVPVRFTAELDDRLPESVEVAVFYLVAECLANIAKHAHASAVEVSVVQRSATVVVEVMDDGVGGADMNAGSGLRGLAERVDELGGWLQVRVPDGGGTAVRVELPCG
jgi:signal transduction histidine kinase